LLWDRENSAGGLVDIDCEVAVRQRCHCESSLGSRASLGLHSVAVLQSLVPLRQAKVVHPLDDVERRDAV